MSKPRSLLKQFLDPANLLATYKEHSTTATILSATVSLILAASIGSLQNYPLLVAGVSAGAISIVITCVAVLSSVLKSKDSSAFFGLHKGRNLVIVLPTFHFRRSENARLPEFPEGPFKASRILGGREEASRWLRLTSYGDLVVVNLLLTGNHKLNPVRLSLIMDERVSDGSELQPPYYDGSSSLVCFGSEQFNDLATLILNHLKTEQGNRAIKFSSNKITIDTELGLGDELTTSESIDYGVLARLTIAPHGELVTMFLCAGIDAAGTRALTNSLFNNWKSLRADTGDRDFFAIYKIMKSNYRNYSNANVFLKPIENAYFFRNERGSFARSSSARMLGQLSNRSP